MLRGEGIYSYLPVPSFLISLIIVKRWLSIEYHVHTRQLPKHLRVGSRELQKKNEIT